MDAYDIYFASAMSATVVLRSICGAVFPLFSPAMFGALGDNWAMTVFALLSFVCVPIPLLFWVSAWLMIFLCGTDEGNLRNMVGGFGASRDMRIKTPWMMLPMKAFQ